MHSEQNDYERRSMSIPSNSPENLKRQMLELEHELELRTKKWEARDKVMSNAVRKLTLAVDERTPAVKLAADAVREAVQKNAETSVLEKVVAELVAATRLSDTPVGGAPISVPVQAAASGESEQGSSRFCALLVSEILYQLLERVALPPEMSARLDLLKQGLAHGLEQGKWGEMLEKVSDLAVDIRSKINEERGDTERFLKGITARLQELDNYFTGTQAQRAELMEAGKALDDALQNEIRGIAATMNGVAEISVLKVQIQSSLEAVTKHVSHYRNREQARHQKNDEQLKELTHRIAEMETESQSLRERIKKEREQALVDGLTGVPNRLAYDERVSQEAKRWKRFKDPVAILVWDIDLFKRINDNYGHAAGDNALRTIAKLMNDKIRETDFLARYGGEEFVLVMPGADSHAAEAAAEKLRVAVASTSFHFRGSPVKVTISCGIAEFIDGDTPESVFERADHALYRSKAAGRNRVTIAALHA